MYSATNPTLQLFKKKEIREQNYDEVNVKNDTQMIHFVFEEVSPVDFAPDSSHSAPSRGLEVH